MLWFFVGGAIGAALCLAYAKIRRGGLVMGKGPIRIWVDDERPMPVGFTVHCRNYVEAITAIEKHEADIKAISLDHDLGEYLTGYDIAKYIVEKWNSGQLRDAEITCHSVNPVGRKNIEQLIRRAEERIWADEEFFSETDEAAEDDDDLVLDEDDEGEIIFDEDDESELEELLSRETLPPQVKLPPAEDREDTVHP